MSKTEKTVLAVLLGLGAVALGVTASLVYQVSSSAELPATTSIEQALTQLANESQPATQSLLVTLPSPGATETGTPPLALGPSLTPPLAIASATPVLALASSTLPVTAPPTQIPIYIVQSGDVLFNIALKFDVSLDDLKGANGLTDNTIFPGQKLMIPVPGLVIPTITPKPPTQSIPTVGPGTPSPTATPKPITVTGGNFGAAAIPGPSPTWSVYAFPTRFPASGPTKLGFHVTLNSGGVLDYVAAVKPAVMKGVDDVGYLKDVKALSPTTVTIGRFTEADSKFPTTQGDPTQKALEFVQYFLPKYQANPWVDYWEGHNEVTYDRFEWYATFEATRACEMQRLGFKAAIGGFSTGTPEPYQLEAFLPAIEAGIRCGAILTTHEYGAPTLYLWWSQGLPESYGNPAVPAYPDRGPLMGRYRYLYYNVLLPRGLNIPLVISETGIDGGAGAGQRPGYSSGQGWLGFGDYWSKDLGQGNPVQFYVDQLAWYDSMLRQDSFVIGATIFNIGNSATWASFDAAPIIPTLTEYALSLK